MKELTKLFGLFAVAAMTVIGCAKEIDAPKEEVINETEGKVVKTHTVTISAGTPKTKTAIVEGVPSASFKWSSTDNARFYIKENSAVGTSIGISSDDSYETAQFSATFETETAASYTYTAFLAKNRHATTDPLIPAEQTSTDSSYDPDADILVAKPLEFNEAQTSLEMQFTRPCVINKMTLKGLTEGETVSSVEIVGDKNLTGYYVIKDDKWTAVSNKITVTTSQTVSASGQVTVYFVTMPVENTKLAVTVISDAHVYNKVFASAINFTLNQVTVFGVGSFTMFAGRDVINQTMTGLDQSGDGGYTAWSSKKYSGALHSSAVYSGQSNKGVPYLQLRNSSPSGIVTTTSGGSVKKVFVVYNTSTAHAAIANARTITVYGKNSVYTGPVNVYNSSDRGTSEGQITYTTGDLFGYLNVSKYYEHVGLLASGAMYFDEIDIFWDAAKDPAGIKWTADGKSGTAVTSASAEMRSGEDESPAAVLYNPNDIPLSQITFTSSNTSVATIGEHTGVLTLLSEGETVIHAVFEGTSSYQASDVYYTLSVDDVRETPEITLNESDENRTTANYAEFTGRSATVSPSVTLTYSKEDDYGVIDEFNTATGALTLTGTSGSATVTVSFAGNTEYKAAVSKSYTINVTDPSKTLSSISVTGAKTKFVKGDTFTFGGTVTANYSDASQTNVTASASFSGYNMSTPGAQTVTASYTEGGVNKTTTYGIVVYELGTLTTSEITSNITKTQCAYGTEKTYNDTSDGIEWVASCNTDAANRPWMQLKKDSSEAYIKITADGTIRMVTLTISSASNSSGGVTDISKHTAFGSSNKVLLTAAADTAVKDALASKTGEDVSSNQVTLEPSGTNSTVYVKVSGGAARIWGIEVAYEVDED